jgi:hypothetical protein
VIFGTLVFSWFGQPSVHAQATARRLTTIDGLRRFSNYFHLQNVILRGEFAEAGSRVVLRGGDSEMQVMLNDATTTGGPVEVRAQLIDVGRLAPTDPRLSRYQNRPDPEHWPTPGEELLLSISSVAKAEPASMPTIRGLALEPWRFDGQPVTVTGQFGGRNLFGDLPASPAKSKYDFVLRGAEGAVWVTGLRPKGKGFDLNVDARVDTSHWLQVTGAVKRERGLVMIEARTMVPASAPATRVVLEEVPPPPKEPGEVVFSSPADGETGVSPTAPIRVQFSRGIDPATLSGNLRISYVGGAPVAPDATAVVLTYDSATHAISARFSKPPEPFRTMKVEVVEGVKTFDGAPVKPWSVTFSVGAN